MTRPATLIGLLLAGLAALALLAPAASPAEAAPPTTSGETTTTSPAPETTTTTPAPEATTPATTAPTSGATTESTPPPATPGAGEGRAAPQISKQSAQGASPSRPAGSADAQGRPKARAHGEKGAPAGAPAAKSRHGKRAPKPSALTPPLPLSLSSSIAGVPAFFIESFRIPPFLLPIFQAAGTAYGVPWQVLAAINEVETDYGRDLSVSTAGAEGWMQFLPSSWATYGVDANGDGFKDPYNPADAIFAAARYLRAAGATASLRGSVFSYNHSQAYVESVMLRAKLLGGTPSGLLGAITGLTEARFPVHAKAHFSDGFPTVPAEGSGAAKQIAGTTIYSEANAPVIAVQDGQVVQIGDSPQLGRFVSLRDAYGNTYTYAKLGSVAQLYPVLKPHDGQGSQAPSQKAEPVEPRPTGPASAGTQTHSRPPGAEGAATSALSLGSSGALQAAAPGSTVTPRPDASSTPQESPAPATNGAPTGSGQDAGASGSPEAAAPTGSAPETSSATPRVFRDGPNDVYLHELHTGARVIAGTVLGHMGGGEGSNGEGPGGEGSETHMLFQIRPAGLGAPQIDPKPILDGWVQLENSSVFRAKGQNPFLATAPSVGQVLLESKEQLQQQVLANPHIDIYPCGRQDIQTGQIDRRVLATLEFLAVSGLKPTVSALKCGHSDLTSEGNVSEHSPGDAVDISEINGIPIAGHQGPGSITDTTIRKLLTLQ
ncbi:MAG TPA: lytic murein transglycosylase, partial [Solirubrobacteraceae bacterium]|nr:lytic murein transglycosylase [Solirubrobacteraceae bacterium]